MQSLTAALASQQQQLEETIAQEALLRSHLQALMSRHNDAVRQEMALEQRDALQPQRGAPLPPSHSAPQLSMHSAPPLPASAHTFRTTNAPGLLAASHRAPLPQTFAVTAAPALATANGSATLMPLQSLPQPQAFSAPLADGAAAALLRAQNTLMPQAAAAPAPAAPAAAPSAATDSLAWSTGVLVTALPSKSAAALGAGAAVQPLGPMAPLTGLPMSPPAPRPQLQQDRRRRRHGSGQTARSSAGTGAPPQLALPMSLEAALRLSQQHHAASAAAAEQQQQQQQALLLQLLLHQQQRQAQAAAAEQHSQLLRALAQGSHEQALIASVVRAAQGGAAGSGVAGGNGSSELVQLLQLLAALQPRELQVTSNINVSVTWSYMCDVWLPASTRECARSLHTVRGAPSITQSNTRPLIRSVVRVAGSDASTARAGHC